MSVCLFVCLSLSVYLFVWLCACLSANGIVMDCWLSTTGCGVFWKRDKFAYVAHASLNFIDEYDEETKLKRSDRCCLCVLVKQRATGFKVVFVSVHFARNPENPELDNLRGKQVSERVSGKNTNERHPIAQGGKACMHVSMYVSIYVSMYLDLCINVSMYVCMYVASE
jgi:hypothetical protein